MHQPKNNHSEPKKNEEVVKEVENIVSLKESEYLKLQEEAAKSKEFLDRLLRLQADFDNTRKRLDREKQEFVKFANEGLIAELLGVLDDLERAVGLAEAKHQDLAAFLTGVEMVLVRMHEMLKVYGVIPIQAEGKIFDPNFHEALLQIVDNEKPEHTVIEEMQKGYMLNGRVIRTAKVKVTKHKTETEGLTSS